MQLSEIRRELRFQTDLLHLIDTLKNIAASQYHMMEKAKERFQPFLDAFPGFFRVVHLTDVDDPLVRVMSDRLGIVVVTSDSGFMGGLNQGVLRAAADAQGDRPDDTVSLVVIGDKGATALGDQGRSFQFFKGIERERIYEQAVEVKNYLVREVLHRRMGKVVIVYPKPLSFTSQTIQTVHLLPCAELFDSRVDPSNASEAKPGKGLLAKTRRAARGLIVESSFSDMLEYLVGAWLTYKLTEIFEDSKLAEFSARALHLEGSHDKVQKEQKKIRHKAFKAVHEQIDKGMRESFSATRTKRTAQRHAG